MTTIMMLFISVGTDIYPAISLAYESSENFIMERKPRSKDDHLVGLKLMINAYCSIGIFETIGSYFAFFWIFMDYGIEYKYLPGTGIDFSIDYNLLTSDRKIIYDQMCYNNTYIN
jgi:sodium/potassium-transporting ATPase subunit alpha